MELSEYRLLPDYLAPNEVERYCETILLESNQETPKRTTEKLREMADRQWHTYELPTNHLQNAIKNWLTRNWTENTNDYLETVMILCNSFGLDSELFSRAFNLYNGIHKEVFRADLENSKGGKIDPWWRLNQLNK